ncbi:MAG: hypothetical protein AB7F59_07130 [Bdellovibrionales bacterium]
MVNNTIKCWGKNERGELGLGDKNHRGDQPGEMGESLPVIYLGKKQSVLSITMGDQFVCALLGSPQQNLVKCWGLNDDGRLGLGESDMSSSRGDGPDEMGDNLPYVKL